MPDLAAFELESFVRLNLLPKVTTGCSSGNLSALSFYVRLNRRVV